jgi:hypothetical protein
MKASTYVHRMISGRSVHLEISPAWTIFHSLIVLSAQPMHRYHRPGVAERIPKVKPAVADVVPPGFHPALSLNRAGPPLLATLLLPFLLCLELCPYPQTFGRTEPEFEP